jgi:hypothetical protein
VTAPTAQQYADLLEDLDALSSQPRLHMIHLLTEPKYAEEIAESLGATRQAAAKHIERLQERGFLRALHGRRAKGPVTEYQVVPQRIYALAVRLLELARLEPTGGPAVRHAEPTVAIAGGAPAALPVHVDRAPPPEGATAHLVILESPLAGERFELSPQDRRWTLGRDEDRDVRITHDPYVSAKHAEVQRSPVGFDLVDSFSSNGTFLNFVPIPRGGRVPLRSGDIVTVGRTPVVFQA